MVVDEEEEEEEDTPFSCIIFSVTQAKPARGTFVAIVGSLASCHPIPVLIMVAPALCKFFAS